MKLKEAIEEANKIADAGLILDVELPFKAIVDNTTGFLTSTVNLARTGVQIYMGYELGLIDRALDKIGVYRSAKEVFHPDSIKSYINLVVTDDHPSELIDTNNVKTLQVGTVSQVSPSVDVLTGVVTITDKKQIQKISDGKVEVSVGYSHKLKKEKGIYDGVEYEFVQTDIRANHLAIVAAGRCGPVCKLTIDKKGSFMFITIDGIQFEIADSQLAQAIQKQQIAHDAEVEGFKKKLSKEEEEKKKLEKEKDEEKAEKDKAQAKADALEKDKMSSDALNTLIEDRAALIVSAKGILGDKMPECIDCPLEIKTAVIDHVLSDMKLEGKSDDYINAAYDMAILKAEKAKKSLDSLSGDFKTKDGKIITRRTARDKYMKDQLGMEDA